MKTMTPPPLRTPLLHTHTTVLAGIVLSGLGIVSSCASSPAQATSQSPLIKGDRDLADRGASDPSPELASATKDQDHVVDGGEQTPEPQQIPAPGDLDPDSTNQALDEALTQNRALTQEIRALYRRLHIELSPEQRSELIVELLNDPRSGHQMLGFELADRDLSASVVLSDAVGQAVHSLLRSPSAQIRAQSARLITRISPPDAMLVLTSALAQETSPVAAEPMLLGIARWPNPEAKASVLGWLRRDDAPLFASFSAAWSVEREGLWDQEVDFPVILERLRSTDPASMREVGMKLLAKLGSAEDLRKLIGYMLSADTDIVKWAASALVETPRAVEELVSAASRNETLYLAAAESLIQHRSTPEGLRRLSELPQSDANTRRDMLLRMGREISRDQLGEAVRLAGLEPEITIAMLSRLVSGEEAQTTRTSKGVLYLAELQLSAGRPNRVIEALLSLEGAPVDPADQTRLTSLRTQAYLLLSRFDEAASTPIDPELWIRSALMAIDPEVRTRIAIELESRAGDMLSESQRAIIAPYLVADDEPEPRTETEPTEGP